MLIFILCLLAMFIVWVLGHVIGFLCYLFILFVGHIMSYWYLYGSLIMMIVLCSWFGIHQIVAGLSLLALTLILMIILTVIHQHASHES